MTELSIEEQRKIIQIVRYRKAALDLLVSDLSMDFESKPEAWPGQELRYELFLIGKLCFQMHDLLTELRYWAEVEAGVREHLVLAPRLVSDKSTDGLTLEDLDL